jgi:hypothetical protein
MPYPSDRTRKLLSCDLKGTTFTGDPLKTTLGNTLRSYFYVEYIAA